MVALCTAGAIAQSARGTSTAPSTPFQGFQNNKEPIKIESASLEVRDKERIATFIDNVKLVQGDTTLECRRLVVYYDEEPAPAAAKGKQPPKSGLMSPPADGQQQVRRLEAKGGVVVTQKDQVATGDNGVYDMKTNSIVLTGNVVMTRGQDVVSGQKLYVDMTTGLYRVESGTTVTPGQSGGVRALIIPGARDAKPGAPTAGTPAAAPLPPPPAAGRTTGAIERGTTSGTDRDAAKQGPSRPLKLN
jgi:lipopolysaccharide export system protein LptA